MTTLNFRVATLPAALLFTFSPVLHAQEVRTFEPVVVTAPMPDAPLSVTTDPKAPRQPVPAHDGADFLKSIPGFSVIRKGGTDGDPVLRGFSGSRLGILLDGQEVYGGCGGRMDPPTAYVYPESFDRVTVLKGPQSVRYGAGQSAGVVLFERDFKRMSEFGITGNASLTGGSFGRNDQMVDATVGGPMGYVRAGGTRAQADDYKDGDGNRVHSEYLRWSSHAAIGLTPDDKTRIELSGNLSDGRAAYADRAMDGTKFKRENVSLLFERKRMGGFVDAIEGRIYYNYVDHVMDNYSLRDVPPGGKYMANNPDRKTTGGRIGTTLRPSEDWEVIVGADIREDVHTLRVSGMRNSSDAANTAYKAAPRTEDMRFTQRGVFAESTWFVNESDRLIGGLRVDWHEARDKRMPAQSATAGQTDKRTLPSGFLRYEQDFAPGSTWYAGLGHAERFPDYWERMHRSPAGSNSAFLSTRPEKTTQLDIGTRWRHGPLDVSVSAFYGRVDDYILINWDKNQTRNVDATVIGGELDAAWQLNPQWQAVASLSYVYGQNRTDSKPLAQQPPLELRLGLNYAQGPWSAGVLWRLAAAQHRYDIGSGGVVSNGKDLGPSSGFGVLSLNAGWRPNKTVLVTAGVDNVFNKTYSEHLSKSGANIPGNVAFVNRRINEPGRVFWLKAQVAFD
ncbi:MAG: TonB-dependent copper receptor [Pusillimonas sp.]